MESYPINLETFSKTVGYDNEIDVMEADISKQINLETKNELINLISWFMKAITRQKEKEILDANEMISNILTNLYSSLKKMNLFTKNFIQLSEAILLSDINVLNALYMPKEEAIYAFTKYIYKSDIFFQKNELISSSEISYYFNLKQKVECYIKPKISFASDFENKIKRNYDILEKFDTLFMWERLNNDLNFLLDLYGENGKYSFIWKYEPELDELYDAFLTKYNWWKKRYLSEVDFIQKTIAFNKSNRSNCLYNSYSWDSYTIINIYNVVSESFIYKTLEIGRKCSWRSFTINLPDSNLFLCRENFYIIDTLNFSIKMIGSVFNHKFESGLYYENCIYLFERNQTLNHSYIFKYDMISNKLSKISTLTKDLMTVAWEIYKNSILIFGHPLKKCHKYDILIESYSKIKVRLTLGSSNYLFANGEKLYFINGYGIIYENQNDEYHWFSAPISCYEKLWRTSYIWKEEKICMVSWERYSIRYDILDLKLKELRSKKTVY